MQNLHTSDAAPAASVSALENCTRDLIFALDKVGKHLAAGAVAANAPAATDREPTSDEQAAPGLLELISRYHRGRKEFSERAPSDREIPDDLAHQTYELPMEAIRNWSGAAEDKRSALAALETAVEEIGNGDDQTALPLVKAAWEYFSGLDTVDRRGVCREDLWKIDDSITQVDGVLALALHGLSRLSDSLHGSPLIHELSALERALQLGRDRLEFASECLGEVGMSLSGRG